MAYATMLTTLLGSSLLAPQIYALTKTMLISTTLLQNPLCLQRTQSNAFCTSMCANESFPSTARPDVGATINILTETVSNTAAFESNDPNDSDIMHFINNWNTFESDNAASNQPWTHGIKVLTNPFMESRKHENFANLGKYLLNSNEISGTKRLFFGTLSTLPGEGIS